MSKDDKPKNDDTVEVPAPEPQEEVVVEETVVDNPVVTDENLTAKEKTAVKDEEYRKFAQGPIFLYTVAILALASFVLSLFALVAATADDDVRHGPGSSYFEKSRDMKDRERGEAESRGDRRDWNNRFPGPDRDLMGDERMPEVTPDGDTAPLPEVAPEVSPMPLPEVEPGMGGSN